MPPTSVPPLAEPMGWASRPVVSPEFWVALVVAVKPEVMMTSYFFPAAKSST